MLIGAALSAALTLTLRLIGGTDAPALGMLWMFVLSLALFFSVHHLAMYYLFQPYSTEWFAKNPFYHLVTLAVSAACGFGLVLRPPIVPFTAVVFTVSVVYLAAALPELPAIPDRAFL